MTVVYFIRHAESDNSVRDGRIRPLTEKGMRDRALVTAFLQDKGINAVLSSPFKRAVDTVADFAEKNGFNIQIIEDFREQKSSKGMGKDSPNHYQFLERQWSNFEYSLSEGESLLEIQKRNIAVLNDVLNKYKDKNIIIGTHGTALSTIVNYYDSTYGFTDFMEMINILPWVVRMEFTDIYCIGMKKIDLFNLEQKPDYNKCVVRTAGLDVLRAYRFTVIFARYMDKWLYCRAKTRDTYETAGGHIEQGETPLEGAKRELYEETGAIKYTIKPVFDYSVHVSTEYSNGQVFLAQIQELDDMPDFEMGEVKLFENIPDKMRFPKILPVLFEKVKNLI